MRPPSTLQRHLPTAGRALLTVATALLIASCTSVQVSGPASEGPAAQAPGDTAAEASERQSHWAFANDKRPPAERDGYRPPLKLAVLLPLTGSLATAAAPVRDGLLAGYYGEQRRRPELVFYDTAGTAGGAATAYSRAVAEGADQVVGPLGREEIDAVYAQASPAAPVIALNRSSREPPINSASFSLAPEDDGVGAAGFLTDRKAKRILVLAGDGDYARRAVSSFNAQLQLKGGSIAQTLAVSGDKPADMTTALLAMTQQPEGVDGVFLALRGTQAAAIAPQLAAAGLNAKPRVATSQLLSGTGKPATDIALDGIAFPTDTWSVTGVRGLPNAALAGQSLATARGPAAKLFAFGYDAWLLSAYLENLANNDQAQVDGATGVLRIGPQGNVQRIPAWSTFSNGNVVPLAGASG